MEIVSLVIGSVGLTFAIIALGQTAALKKEITKLKENFEKLKS